MTTTKEEQAVEVHVPALVSEPPDSTAGTPVIAGDETPVERFDRLYGDLHPRLYGLAYRLMGDAGEAEDVVQETFLRLAGDRVVTRPEEEVRAWCRRVCLNLASNRLRSRARSRARLERVGRLDAAVVDDDRSGPLAAVLRREERDAVREALAGLPERQRSCLLLRHSGYSYAEIAVTLDVAVGSVGVLLARAERRFRRRYRRFDDVLS